ncbi:MAG TPA: YiiD C-terminal domain-containing protein [Dokdonella sp.]|uniref:YiiD C-terminal domain-containing protein n=1 Tax=Dokdonella sp. TaxID=2291710 RepID=UPI002CD2DD26|nr:YiiD C-terminal domain-containing protein [Dokdonella sp.]HUD41855.1 YiiD C-terminal domain-containing protein [Dokdonella sp.]
MPASAAPLHDLERKLRDEIPLARAMDLRVAGYDGRALTLAAPLPPNINDKGCAFGGSLASLMTLAGWGLARLQLEARGADAEVYIADSVIRYLAPVWGDFSAIARPAEGESFDAFFDILLARGRARIGIVCEVPLQDGTAAASLSARFVAIDPARMRGAAARA